MRWLKKAVVFSFIAVLMILISSCADTDAEGNQKISMTDEQNVVKEPLTVSKAEVAEGGFVYRLASEKSVYAEGEKVEVYAELEYVGDEPEIKIAHAASPFSFPMKEKTRNFEIDYKMSEPRIVTTLKKGVPLKSRYEGSGGYGSQDPKEYVDFIKAVHKASKTGTLPWGNYLVSGLASFEPIYESDETQVNESLHLKAEIEFIVEKPENKE
ncbi:hypothetical protein [Paenibacillus sp. LHD-38]|uniref:hypothetical protein n=1 Tax=Paenibacillus sp. LHD-38 TaxID=3072143 RepID=UPI00280DDB26|nr:hypothetical protein [Paenibacillus sp. LHD-38]MDQ8738232.1 hypothetical protein [Paenibacillus sp. LHD-38]